MADLGMLAQLLGNIGSRQYTPPDYAGGARNAIALRQASQYPQMQRIVSQELSAPSPDQGRILGAIGQYDPMEAARMQQADSIARFRMAPTPKTRLDEAQQAYNQVVQQIASRTNQAKTFSDVGDTENFNRLMAEARALEPQRDTLMEKLRELAPQIYGAPTGAGAGSSGTISGIGLTAPAPEVAPDEGVGAESVAMKMMEMDIYDANGVLDPKKFAAVARANNLEGDPFAPNTPAGRAWTAAGKLAPVRQEAVSATRAEQDRQRQIAEEKKAKGREAIENAAKSWNLSPLAKALRALPNKVPALTRSALNLNDPAKANAAAGSVIKAAGQLVEEGVVNQGDVDLIIGGNVGLKGLINTFKSWSNPESINVPAARQAYNNARDIVDGITREGRKSLAQAIKEANAKAKEYGVTASEADFASGLTWPEMPPLGGAAQSSVPAATGAWEAPTDDDLKALGL
jgi:hypothetical protein